VVIKEVLTPQTTQAITPDGPYVLQRY